MLRVLIRPEWIEALAGTNSVAGNLAGVAFGVFMYFPTLVEVPIAKMFLDLGMHRGPLLAYLMADPELSLQSILIISAIIGRRKTAAYVGLVALFSAVAGLAYGAWVDGAPPLLIALSRRRVHRRAGVRSYRAPAPPITQRHARNLTMLTIKVFGPGCATAASWRRSRRRRSPKRASQGEIIKVTDVQRHRRPPTS